MVKIPERNDNKGADLDLCQLDNEPTSAIDLNSLFNVTVTESGCYDFRKTNIDAVSELLQAMPVPSALVDRSYAVICINTAFLKISGDYPDNASLEFPSLFSHPKESGQVRTLLDEALKSPDPGIWENVFHVCGKRMWGRIHLRRLRIGAERIILVQIENLTAEKQLLLAEKYRKLVGIFPIGIAEFAFRARITPESLPNDFLSIVSGAVIVGGNNQFASMHGLQRIKRLAGVTLIRLLGPEEKNKAIIERWISSGFSTFSFETNRQSDTGELQYFENSLIGSTIKENLKGFWWLKKDITIRKRLEQEILKSQKIESLGILAGGIAHDFNNLLTGILGNISLLRRKFDPLNNFSHFFEDAEKACLRSKELTRQLLTFSKGGEPVKKAVNLKELLKDTAAFGLRGANVTSDFKVPDDLPPTYLDEGQIAQVLQNLIINAIQAMPNGGVIQIKAGVVAARDHPDLPLNHDRYVRVSIRDQGQGIHPANLTKIFDPYFTSKPGGSGLGLAIAYSIMKKHGGLVTVRSRLGVGTQFYLYFPAAFEKNSVSAKKRTIAAPAGAATFKAGPPLKILVMDDEELIRNFCSELLSAIGCRAAVAKNGEEAILAYKYACKSGEPFDLVLMDLTIPGGMDGKETIQKMLEFDPNVRAVVSSGYCDSPVMADYRKFGFVDVLPKPFTAEDIEMILKRTGLRSR